MMIGFEWPLVGAAETSPVVDWVTKTAGVWMSDSSLDNVELSDEGLSA